MNSSNHNQIGTAYGLFVDEFASTDSSNMSFNNTKTSGKFPKASATKRSDSKNTTGVIPNKNPFLDSFGDSSIQDLEDICAFGKSKQELKMT